MNITQTGSLLHNYPNQQNLFSYLAEHILQQYADSLPDLSQLTVLFSTPLAISPFRRELMDVLERHGIKAVLGPQILTLNAWVNQQVLPSSDAITHIIGDQARELLLVEALKEFPGLLKDSNPWQLAASLIPLFDDLTRYHVKVPEDIQSFIDQLGQAYGVEDLSLHALTMEATLVHRLWLAMQQDLKRIKAIDNVTAYLLRLKHSAAHLHSSQHIIVAGQFDFIPAEIEWLGELLKKRQLTIITQSAHQEDDNTPSAHPTLATIPDWHAKLAKICEQEFDSHDQQSAAADYFHQVFNVEGGSLLQRSTELKSRHVTSPVDRYIKCFAAASAEEEAVAIDVRLRQWLLRGRKRLALVTENRRLARRVRALLERADVILQDSSGWALSTTSAATVIERWLECIEQDFHYQALLDFLKSPFVGQELTGAGTKITSNADQQTVNSNESDSDFLSIVHRFEVGVIIHENIASNLQRYRTHTEYRINRVADNMRAYYADILPLLDKLHAASQALLTLLNQQGNEPAQYLDALEDGLKQLGVWQSLTRDAAGELIIELLRQMRRSSEFTCFPMNWTDFRTWLGQTLERSNFIPDNSQYHVQLLSLAQTDLQQFDGVVIAAAEYDYLPGATAPSPFFNDAVRSSLGIPVRRQANAHNFRLFRRLLESCIAHSENMDSTGSVLFTRRHSENTEEIQASPWLEAIQSFHQLAYANDLTDPELGQLLLHPESTIQADDRPLPALAPAKPVTTIPPSLIPAAISATAYQQIIDCPYQFFAARCLQLAAPDTVRELLEKDDYGNRVHRCLEAFHTDIPGIDGPFTQLINANNRAQAIMMLENISRQIFSRDIENNFLHRGWLKQWLSLVPDYIDWQINRNMEWRVSDTERRYSDVALGDTIRITGILDRIDEHNGQRAIIDYKTGYVPAQDEIDNGEAVQLPFYAMLLNLAESNDDASAKPIQRVEYLSLSTDNRKFGSRVSLENEALNDVTQQNQSRLIDIVTALQQGNEMIAWGDTKVCHYCRFDSLCRKQFWDNKTDSAIT